MPLRMAAAMAAAQGLLGLLLAVMGLYAVVSYAAGQRTHEIGVRMALGARRRDVLRLVVRDGLRLTLTGVALGLLLAFGVGFGLSRVLYGRRARRPPPSSSGSLPCWWAWPRSPATCPRAGRPASTRWWPCATSEGVRYSGGQKGSPAGTNSTRTSGDERLQPGRALLHPQLLGDVVAHEDEAARPSLADRVHHVEDGLPFAGLADHQHLDVVRARALIGAPVRRPRAPRRCA